MKLNEAVRGESENGDGGWMSKPIHESIFDMTT